MSDVLAPEALKVHIRPEVTILSVLQHLNYRPWFALAEFVDNALESFIQSRDAIQAADKRPTILKVNIEVIAEGLSRISIRDNAAGIAERDFPRAFRPAELPPTRTGLCEFGMGMKSAACWFARRWSVRTKALGERLEHTVKFDIDQIVGTRQEEIAVTSRLVDPMTHYTEVVLEDLHHPPKGRTIGKIKDHLASIYRVYLRNKSLELYFGPDQLVFEDPAVLEAAHYKDPTGPRSEWRKELNFDYGLGDRVTGFAALRATASTPYAGFALFRRNRLIQGSADETYRPLYVFGNSNSYRYQRLFGELHLEGFEVSHTKDGFRWEEHEDMFLEHLKEALESAPLNLLEQAEGFRVRATKKSIEAKAKDATDTVADTVADEVPWVLQKETEHPTAQEPLPTEIPASTLEASSRTVSINDGRREWEVTIRTTVDPAQGDWLRLGERHALTEQHGRQVRCLVIEVSLAHSFSTKYLGATNENLELLLAVAAGLAIALIQTEDATGENPNVALGFLNTLMSDALSKVKV